MASQRSNHPVFPRAASFLSRTRSQFARRRVDSDLAEFGIRDHEAVAKHESVRNAPERVALPLIRCTNHDFGRIGEFPCIEASVIENGSIGTARITDWTCTRCGEYTRSKSHTGLTIKMAR
jgi:hypothetical protein